MSIMQPFILVLGIAQDGGVPHVGCTRPCCRAAWGRSSARRYASSIAIVDPKSRRRWIIDASPDFKDQLHLLELKSPRSSGDPILDGIFLTHGHAGHYLGLMQLDKAMLDAESVPVHVMPRMERFIRNNEPWRQLVRRGNISLRPLQAHRPLRLAEGLTIEAVPVPHRDELTETTGFRIQGPRKILLFIPDIDVWNTTVEEEIAKRCDAALLDGTFFDLAEIGYRDPKEIPHPLITDSINRFAYLPARKRGSIYFTHLNHTNPALRKQSARRAIEKAGFRIAEEGQKIVL